MIPALLLALALPETVGATMMWRTEGQVAETRQDDFMGTLRKSKANALKNITTEERNDLEFLYRYMPLADVTDYKPEFFLDNVRASLLARQEMPWGKEVPDLLFRHFVLPVRVNNENLDNSRMVFYAELKKRIANLSMKEAILEVNHWCHERVTYQPSDGRTSAPLATVCSAYGRCGEQSTFAVAALRSVGIPARQVYTPRWAHTDDNHAWVEAWADGKWWFLGACEPEPVLNLGWFNAPASRAMLMHTRAFGDYRGPEEVMLRTSNYTEINLIDNYAETARADFSVVDADGKPVDKARVDFRIYNYAEFCPVVTKYTDAQGHTYLTAGKGDMLAWASHNGMYGFAKVSFGKDSKVEIHLTYNAATTMNGVAYSDSIDILPPPEKPNLPYVSAEQREENNRRFAEEDSIRHAYLATFFTKQTALKALTDSGLAATDTTTCGRMADFLVKSSGNHETILRFLTAHKDNLERAIGLLSTLSDKDLRDIPTEILEDNFMAESSQLSLRVENEMIIRPFKRFFEKTFTKRQAATFRSNPAKLVEWIKKNVRMNPDARSLMIAQTPVGVWESRVTDRRSRKIFFVDVARSLGIEARVDAVTQKTQYRRSDEWIDVDFDGVKQVASDKGRLLLNYADNGGVDDPKYYSHFSITRINADGSTTLLEYPEDGVTWGNTFKDGVELDVGQYILVTGTRLANGGVMSAMTIFGVEKGKTTAVDMKLRTSATEVTVIGNFNSEAMFSTLDGKKVSFLSQTGRGYFITGLIGVGQEPTNHALKDIAKVADVFDKWGRPLVLLFEDEAAAKKFNAAEFSRLPRNVIYGIDKDGSVRREICANMKLASPSLSPIFFISDTFNRVVFLRQGYTISLGEQMEQVIKSI